jgi:hypothetical protein
MELLLREAESTVSGNIPVSKGIDLFGRPGLIPTPAQPPLPPPPRKKFLTSLSPRKQLELRRRQSKRASTQHDSSPGIAGSSDSPSSFKKTPRSYKRISRPLFSLPLPAATADLSELLAAYLLDASAALPSTPSSSSTLSSLATPRSSINPYTQSESEGPELDLLEPSPSRAPKALNIFGSPIKEPTRNISGIFEVLDDAGSPGQRR